MFKSIFKVAFRNLRRQKGYSFINILGLTIGLAISLIIAFYVIDDLTYDNFHKDADNIYRVLTTESTNTGSMTYSITCGPLIPAAKESIPEIKDAVRTFAMGRPFVAAGVVPQNEMNASNSIQLQGFITEPEFFDVFSFKFLKGDRENALKISNGVLLTPKAAKQLFNDEDPIGKRLTVQFMGPGNGEGQQDPYVIGLIEEPPLNSHIQYDFVIHMRIQNFPQWWDSWENFNMQAYLKLNEGADASAVEKKMVELAEANNMPEINKPKLQKLLDVHLGSADYRYDFSNRGKNDKTVVYALAIIGLMIILVAAVNFINLSSARASKRAREVGMRKVIGSNKSMLIAQFLGESVFITVISMILTLAIIELTLPYIDNLLGKTLEIHFFSDPLLLLSMLIIAIIIGILSGLYPAFILSSFKPVLVLKGNFQRSGIGSVVRKFLVLFQFAVTISLAIGVMIIHDQINYLKSIDMGYNRDQVITSFAPPNNGDLYVERLKTLPGVVAVGRSSGIFGNDFGRYEVLPEGASRDQSEMFQTLFVDDNYLNTLEILMADGRSFLRDFKADTNASILINEIGAKKLGWDNPLGKRLSMVEIDGSLTTKQVVGVVKDFHFNSMKSKIEPLFFQLNTQNTFLFSVKLAGGQIEETIDKIGKIYAEVYPNNNFNFQFLDDAFDQQFQNDRNFAANIAYFSGFAIFIACLGLIGLVAYSVEQRKSEIAVRKVLGSSEGKIVFLLAKEFLKWVLVANLIAWPLSYFGIGLWLDSFTYKVTPGITPFLISGFAAMIVAFLTMFYQSLKAARSNPVEALRNN